jgi:glycosyltransferase involved in cell wall biosynthesis
MRLLFCCEFYFPSMGGVQEVMRQLAERMVQHGHEVIVATTRLAERDFNEYNGVRIVEFGITGNAVRGMEGELERYRDYVMRFDGDAIMIKAAQQWTFDALWPVLDQIRPRKVFIPCGFSGLYEPAYAQYFKDLPDVLRRFDHLIFYAERYRDIDFARQHELEHCTILPNGASEVEFSVALDETFRARHSIAQDSFVFLTVGSMTGVKGHREVVEAFSKLRTDRRNVTLILNGNLPPAPIVVRTVPVGAELSGNQPLSLSPVERLHSKLRAMSGYLARRLLRVGGLAWRFLGVVRREGAQGVKSRVNAILVRKLAAAGRAGWIPVGMRRSADPIRYWMERANRQAGKQVLKVDLPRPELVQAFKNADLFVFASNIEYSPLVLFEAAAAGTPFLSVPVGNAEEIARWTEGGVICAAPKDERGYTRAEPEQLAAEMRRLMEIPTYLEELGMKAHQRWQKQFTWEKIAERYEAILLGDVEVGHTQPSDALDCAHVGGGVPSNV